MVRVIEAVMTVIVANRRDNNRKEIKLGEGCEPNHFTLDDDVVGHLKYISSMDVIVILNITAISFLDFAQKSCERCLVDLCYFVKTKLLHDVDGHH